MRHIFLALVIALAAATPGAAHHSFAMFDRDKVVMITGVVKEVQWTNPHTWIQIMAPYKGKVVEWSIEGRSPNVLERRGWKRTTLKPGETVTISLHPMKDGTPAGAITRIRWPDGRELNADTPSAVDTDEEGYRK